MAIGDAATQSGFELVPESGEDGKVRWGAREINKTRDMIAKRSRSGTEVPSNSMGENGDIYFKII